MTPEEEKKIKFLFKALGAVIQKCTREAQTPIDLAYIRGYKHAVETMTEHLGKAQP